MQEILNQLAVAIVTFLSAVLYAEARSRVSGKKTVKTVDDKLNHGKKTLTWESNVKRYTYKHFNMIKARLYDSVDKLISDRQDSNIVLDRIDMKHGVKVDMPLDKRSVQLRSAVRDVIEDVRSWVKDDIVSEDIYSMSLDEIHEFTENLTKNIRETIENDMIKTAYKSELMEDIFLDFRYSDLLDTIKGIVKHAVRSKK